MTLAGVATAVVLADTGESHPHGDPALVPLVDGGRVVAGYDDCSDEKGLGYIKNDLCIDYRLVQASRSETVTAFLSHEVRALDAANWRLFSPADFGAGRSVIARTDLYGHDCLLLGRPAEIPLSMEETDVSPIPKFWGMLRRKLRLAQHRARPIIGLQVYPGPANDAEHRVC